MVIVFLGQIIHASLGFQGVCEDTKCFYCGQEARAICGERGRACRKEHRATIVHRAHVRAGFRFVYNDCLRAAQNPSIEVPST